MRNLLKFLANYNHVLLFIILEIISFSMLMSYNGFQYSVWLSSANAVAGKYWEMDANVRSYLYMKSANSLLTKRNIELEQENQTMRRIISKDIKDSLYITATLQKTLEDYKLIPAKVISNETSKANNLITINKGEADGVRCDMGVACGNGVVGIVFLTSQHYSVVIPVLNSQSNISCSIRRRGYFGYLKWQGGAIDEAYVEDVPRHAHYATGDIIQTSGYSAVFPEGLEVGKVLRTYNSADGLSYRIKIKLSTDFGHLRDVFVIDNTEIKERVDLMRTAKDSIATLTK